MSLVFATLNIVYKQAALSNLTKNSAVAFYAADSGIECGRYWSAYGAFNTGNPAVNNNPVSSGPFSTLDCAGNTPSSLSINAALVNPLTLNSGSSPLYDPAFPFSNPAELSYSLSNVYSGVSNAPQADVTIWQNGQFAPDATQSYFTTAILSTGSNNNNSSDPLRVQRGVGTEAAITQCLAPAFTFGLNGKYPNSLWTGYQTFTSIVTPFFPGMGINALGVRLGATLVNNKTLLPSNFFPYLSYFSADNWKFTPQSVANAPAVISVTATLLQVPSSPHYQFGYYVGDGLNTAAAVSSFVPIADNENGSFTVAIPASQDVHFAVCTFTDSDTIASCHDSYASGSDASFAFWSTDFSANTTDSAHAHTISLSLPMPNTPSGLIQNPGDPTNTRIGGKYVFGFDTGSSISNASTYANVVVLLQLVGCP